MSILAVANCPCCGRVYQRNLRNLCMDCIKDLEKEYNDCYHYLRSNRKATTAQLCSATGVSIQRVTGWVKDKRLSINDYPNLTYACSSCGDPIRHQKLCFPCSSRLTKEIREMQANQTKTQNQGIGYYSFKQR